MKFVILCSVLSLFIGGLDANAAIYKCKAAIGTSEGKALEVNTATNFQYIFLFFAYPNAQPWCGTAIGSNKLHCELKNVTTELTKIYAAADILVGDKLLTLESSDCEGGLGCKMECNLSSNEL